jgi:plasmid maintenance system antidote protein VapI
MATNYSSLKRALQQWAEENGIKPPEFARRMDYSYQHAYRLLRGDLDVTNDTIGRLVLNYGTDAVAEITALANQSAPTA